MEQHFNFLQCHKLKSTTIPQIKIPLKTEIGMYILDIQENRLFKMPKSRKQKFYAHNEQVRGIFCFGKLAMETIQYG